MNVTQKKSEPMRRIWSEEPCIECGIEGFASRSMPVPKRQPYLCEGCESYAAGYADGCAEDRIDILSGEDG